MRFGLFGSAAARRGSGEFDSAEGYRDFIEYNVEAETLGFHGTFVVEHHFTGFGQVSATLNLLTWLGARTRTLRLGTAVIVLPWHNPVLLAEQAATLDLLSGGRLDFGIGKGYRYNEFAGFDMPMQEADARFEESLEVLLKAWTSEQRFSHQGKYWRFNDIVVEPPAAQKPHPQIWMGAGSERSIRSVAQRGFKRRLHNRLRQLKLATQPDGTVLGGPDRATGDPHTVNINSAMYGNPDEIARRLESLHQAGVGYVLVNGGGSGGGERGRQSMRRFAREVMPSFARQVQARAAE